MRDYRFPNIRRADDPATVWLHLALLQRLQEPVQIVLAAAAFRLFGGSVEAGEAMVPMFLESGYDEGRFLAAVGPRRGPFNRHVCPHLRVGTLSDAVRALRAIEAADGFSYHLRGESLCGATGALSRVRQIGPEMAYEIVCDLRRTPVLQDAPDTRTWAFPSRSAVLAAGTITNTERRYTRRADRRAALLLMWDLLDEAQPEYADWELSEIQRGLTLFHFWTRKANPPRRYRWK